MLGQEIRKYMDDKGIKQVFLADKTGIKPQIINAMLQGTRKIETIEYFLICDALEVQPEYFAIKIGFFKDKKKQEV